MECLFCDKEFKKKDKKGYGYGICAFCRIDMLRTMKKKEYKLLVKGKDIKLVNEKMAKELKGQGYKVIK